MPTTDPDHPTPPAAGHVLVRVATDDDDAALLRVERVSFTPDAGFPSQWDRSRTTHFAPHEDPADSLVAVLDGEIVGFVRTGVAVPVPENAHVLAVQGLEVDPAVRRRGVGSALLRAVEERARGRGARKIQLRVFATNAPAQALYASHGYVVEGVLRAEFVIDGQPVDDVVMARFLAT